MSSVVIDANIILAFGADHETAIAVGQQLDSWAVTRTSLHAPALLQYEVASGAHVIGGRVAAERVERLVKALDVQLHEPPSASELARCASSIKQRKAYDSAYLLLAAELGTTLYTLDRRLSNAARKAGFSVCVVGDFDE